MIGAILAFVILVGGFAMASENGGHINGMVFGICFALACLVGITTFVLGILVAAQCQTQLTTLDTAVNTSRHLKDDEVARILSRRFSM